MRPRFREDFGKRAVMICGAPKRIFSKIIVNIDIGAAVNDTRLGDR
jgi:hypothetical protein